MRDGKGTNKEDGNKYKYTYITYLVKILVAMAV